MNSSIWKPVKQEVYVKLRGRSYNPTHGWIDKPLSDRIWEKLWNRVVIRVRGDAWEEMCDNPTQARVWAKYR